MLCVGTYAWPLEVRGVKIVKGPVVLAKEFELDLEGYRAGFEGFLAGK